MKSKKQKRKISYNSFDGFRDNRQPDQNIYFALIVAALAMPSSAVRQVFSLGIA